MVKPAHRRKRKYEAGLDPEKIKRNLAAVKEGAVELQSVYFPEIVEVERKTKRLCEAAGVSTHLIAQYLIYARQLYSKAKKFGQATFAAEAQNILDLWLSRGLLCAILLDIGELFGVTLTCVPPAEEVSTQHYGYWWQLMVATMIAYASLNEDTLSSEVASQTPSPPCTFQEMKVRIRGNTMIDNTVFTLRVNGVNTALTLTVPAGANGTFTVQASVSVADNDLVCLQIDASASAAGQIYFNPCFRSTVP